VNQKHVVHFLFHVPFPNDDHDSKKEKKKEEEEKNHDEFYDAHEHNRHSYKYRIHFHWSSVDYHQWMDVFDFEIVQIAVWH
jgi:hypothetical protein